MAFIVLRLLTIISFLSLSNATSDDHAHYAYQDDMDSPTTSTLSSDLPKTVIYAPEPSGLSTSYRPASSSRVAEHPVASTGTTPPDEPQQQPYGTGLYPGPRQSYPLFYNTSSTSGPTASYGTAVSSGFPWSNDFLLQQPTGGSRGGLAVPSDCPPPSTITIQDTITASPTTITAPPITVTVTSTVSVRIEPAPETTPTVTLTITTTVCAGSGQNTNIRGNGSSDVTPTKGGGQPGGGFSAEQGGFEPSHPPDIGIESVVVTPSPVPSFVPGRSYPQDFGSGSVNQPYQTPNSNSTGYQAPSFPESGDDQFTGNADEPILSVERPPNTSLPPDTGADGHATSSGQSDFGEEATTLPAPSTTIRYPKNNDSVVSSDEVYGEASGNIGTQETNTPYQPPAEVPPDEGHDSENTQMLPELSNSQGAGILIPSGPKPDEIGSGSAFMKTSTTLPYGFNDDAISSGFETGSYSLGTNPGTTSATEMPQLLPSYGQEGHDTSSAPNTTSNVVPPIETSVANGSGGSGTPIPSNPTDAGFYGMPPFVNSTNSMSSTGITYQPTPGTAPASQGSGNLPPTTSFPAYQPVPYPTPSSNLSSTIHKIDLPTATGDITLAYQTSSVTGIIYTTMTEEVVPYPMETATNSSSTPEIVSFKLYNNYSPPSTTGSVSDVRGDAGDDDDGLGSTSAINSDNDPLPTSSQPQQVDPKFDTTSSATPQQPLPTLTPTSSSTVKDG
ncbi:MAG: hypothetical protein Q9199_006796, partial [Rusavskia elegans]